MSDYKVKKGDNLNKIAKAHNMSLQELLKLNNIDPAKANHIKIGQSIKIKSSQSDASTPAEQRFSSSTREAAQEWGKSKVEEVKKQGQAAEQAVKAKREADKKANAGVQTPMKPQLVSRTKAQATNLQEQLVAIGYDLGKTGKNKDGVDGDWGSKSEAALAQAQKDGYVLKDGKLVKSEQKPSNTNTSYTSVPPPSLTGVNYALFTNNGNPENSSENVPESNFWGDLGNFIGRVNPFTRRPYKGTEEEARQLGYKHYTTNGFTRYPVSYSIEGSENMNAQQLAQAQLDEYGITEEQVRDKSPMQNLAYQYSPGYGYNILRMGENMIRGNKVREDGQRNTETIETPVADKITSKVADALDFMGFDKTASDLRESNTYPVNESAQRNDISNLYFGYPMNGNTLRVSPRTETGKGHKPENGYFFEFTNANHIYQDPAYREAVPGGAGVQAKGENMGNWSASIDANGKKAYYDDWDLNPFTKIPGLHWLPNMNFMGTNYELYGKQK